ncbi:uncharacterized protein LOC143018120 [Oratosquilla oratoria]|uniref:uncharacterized protein LOC143018120 n=1 Tax=Oratosquilla oratoria TaxID=337810 RepID=UPI003F75B919
MIFVATQMMEKSREQNQGLFIAFVDLAKAFDTINREMLWRVVVKCGCPPKLMAIIRAFHDAVNYRLDGNLFNPQRLKAKTKARIAYVFDMQYADDAAYSAPNLQSLQRNLDTVNRIYSAGDLVVNVSKTEVLPIQLNTAVPIPPFTSVVKT